MDAFIFVVWGIIMLIGIAGALRRLATRNSVDRELGLLQYANSIGMEFYIAYPGPGTGNGLQDSPYAGENPSVDFAISSLLSATEGLQGHFGATADPFALQFSPFEPFRANQGYAQQFTELMVKAAECDEYMFRYAYVTGDTNNRTTHVWSIAAARVPLNLPVMTLKHETLMTKIGEHLGLKELRFESNEFNERYCVQCADEKRAYSILDPKMIDYLMGLPSYFWQMQGPWIVVARQVTEHDPQECLQRLKAIVGFIERIPGFVRQDLAVTPYWHSPLDLGYVGGLGGQ